MSVSLPLMHCSLNEPKQPPSKRPRIMNTPPAEADEAHELASPPPERDTPERHIDRTLADLIPGNQEALTASWERLLHQLREETETVKRAGSDIIPGIDFEHLSVPSKAQSFFHGVQRTGTGIIRRVISENEAAAWTHDLDTYLRDNPHTQQSSPPASPDLYELFWSLAQLNGRGHPNVLAAQEAVMSGCWHSGDAGAEMLVSTRFPVAYADRVRMTRRSLRGSQSGICRASSPMSSLDLANDVSAVEELRVEGCDHHVDGEVFRKIRTGKWDCYDPWDSSARLKPMGDSEDSVSSAFKMFGGILSLSIGSPDEDPPMRLCPLPVKLTTAYRALRPLFVPKRGLTGSREEFLSASNWMLDTTTTCRSWSEERREALYPHLELDKTLIALPPLSPGDYVLWHPDMLQVQPHTEPQPQPLPPSPAAQNGHWSPTYRKLPSPPPKSLPTTATTTLHLPITPLTLANATYLARQRRAFILGLPAPDFRSEPGAIGESCHMGRPGVQEVNEAGGEAALRAMGLLAWDVDKAGDEAERRLLDGANAILFPEGG